MGRVHSTLHHFVQCLVLPAPGSKPVGAVEKILLVDGVQQLDHYFLHDLILEDRNRITMTYHRLVSFALVKDSSAVSAAK